MVTSPNFFLFWFTFSLRALQKSLFGRTDDWLTVPVDGAPGGASGDVEPVEWAFKLYLVDQQCRVLFQSPLRFNPNVDDKLIK